MGGVSIADPSDVVVSVEVLWVGVQLQMLLPELEARVAEYHGLNHAVRPGFDQLPTALEQKDEMRQNSLTQKWSSFYN